MTSHLWVCFSGKSCHTSGDAVVERHVATTDLTSEEQKRGCPMLVEMFLWQRCTTSPAAEMVLSRLGRGDFEVVVLAFHVDYWDYMGWKDPFGSSQWTVRQKSYVEALGLDNTFTQQVMVQGKFHCAGNEESALIDVITHAPRFPSPSFQATFRRRTLDSLQVSLTGTLRSKVDSQGVNVIVALYERGLVTDIPRGENKGRVLSNNYVVRRPENPAHSNTSLPKRQSQELLIFLLWDEFTSNKCGLPVFVHSSSHQIFGSQSFHLPDAI